MKKLFMIFAVFSCFSAAGFAQAATKTSFLYEELANEEKAVHEVMSITGVSEKDIKGDYKKVDLKDMLMAYSCSCSLDAFLSGDGTGSNNEDMTTAVIYNIQDKYRNYCDRIFKVKVTKGIYLNVNKTQLSDEMYSAIQSMDSLSPVEKNVINKSDISYKCFGRKLTIRDSITACVVAAKTGKDLSSIAEKRMSGVDWETLIYDFRQSNMFVKSNYFRWIPLVSMRTGETVGYVGSLYKVHVPKRIQGKISVEDLNGILSACATAASTVSIPEGYKEMSQDQEQTELAEKICKLINADQSVVLESIKKTDKIDQAVKIAIIANKTKKAVNDIITEKKKYQTIGMLCKQFLKLSPGEIKEINDLADSAMKTLEKK
ncbi:MAG: hypothetical protein A2452_04765 [Candidatus Firestonebacteria bacterium RIFOXYC2_FULL_39_67]|nr:MAG: hypothetical protein A2536_11300 [Candidatus Firestonebacteria bacterium RIFOXYD2_FULL_39_29]OGF53260.1 MAG: hypothetical protein A2497_02695 [Candidatus Firestonebacteria bacterium RifOxyC12_full_39_7]OGF55790.1 MAG: hypothetical protein A2452_04765 [Candidatus Firestonebacteria bacterium RIFOXYC2_FULL_39_67]